MYCQGYNILSWDTGEDKDKFQEIKSLRNKTGFQKESIFEMRPINFNPAEDYTMITIHFIPGRRRKFKNVANTEVDLLSIAAETPKSLNVVVWLRMSQKLKEQRQHVVRSFLLLLLSV